ncbi:MAG: hypothetical protein ACOC41_01165 [Chitinivibrionales bacterium]
MIRQESLLILDAAMIILMVVLASLSKRLGEALKIPPVYRMLHVGVIIILGSAALSGIVTIAGESESLLILSAVVLRVAAGIIAVISSLRYWHWLFSEYFKG